MALFQMGFSDHTSGSGSVYLRTADSGINKIEARAELLFASTKGSVHCVQEADVNVVKCVTSEAEHNHSQLHLFLFFRREPRTFLHITGG